VDHSCWGLNGKPADGGGTFWVLGRNLRGAGRGGISRCRWGGMSEFTYHLRPKTRENGGSSKNPRNLVFKKVRTKGPRGSVWLREVAKKKGSLRNEAPDDVSFHRQKGVEKAEGNGIHQAEKYRGTSSMEGTTGKKPLEKVGKKGSNCEAMHIKSRKKRNQS